MHQRGKAYGDGRQSRWSMKPTIATKLLLRWMSLPSSMDDKHELVLLSVCGQQGRQTAAPPATGHVPPIGGGAGSGSCRGLSLRLSRCDCWLRLSAPLPPSLLRLRLSRRMVHSPASASVCVTASLTAARRRTA